MIRKDLGCYLGIVSHARPDNVPKMAEVVGAATWYVNHGEAADYEKRGAEAVVEVNGLIPARNAVLEDAFKLDLPCVQFSDDLKDIWQLHHDGRKTHRIRITVAEAIGLLSEVRGTPFKLAGVAQHANAGFYNPNNPISTGSFVVGDMIYVLPNNLMFDGRFQTMEDFDYTIQHCLAYGGVLRRNDVQAEFAHRQEGGCQTFRNPQQEMDDSRQMIRKWGTKIIRPHRKGLPWVTMHIPKGARS